MEKDAIPILSIEDGFGELDHAGWQLLMNGDGDRKIEGLGDRIFVIGDDLVTTKDETIERCAKNREINTALIKANQIGTLSETLLAMLTSLAYGAAGKTTTGQGLAKFGGWLGATGHSGLGRAARIGFRGAGLVGAIGLGASAIGAGLGFMSDPFR